MTERVAPASPGGQRDAAQDPAATQAGADPSPEAIAHLARDRFLAIVSHELRSPLNGIKSWTHVLENHLQDPDPTVRRALAGILLGVEQQVRLIDDLLDVSRALSGRLGLATQPLALLPVLEEAVETLRASIFEKKIALHERYELEGAELHGDRDRLRQVFANLLANAVKFTLEGGAIHLIADREGATARIEVRDSGAGIEADFMPFVFDPFRQASTDSRRSQGGMGMGLALAQRLIQLHGGEVSCESEGAGRGSTFRIYLPLRRDLGRPAPHARSNRQEREAQPSLQGVDVLVIDDQQEVRDSLCALLSQAGATVHAARSGHEALVHLALSDAHLPEVIVCDIAMPDEDGYATLRRIRKWEVAKSRRAHPAIALSAFAHRDDHARTLAEGFHAHLTKPVVPAKLVGTIAALAAKQPC